MIDSMAQPGERAFSIPLERPAWKTAFSWAAAILMSLIFLVSGIWKVTDPQGAAMRMAQAKVPESLSLFAALAFGISETLAGVLVLIPRFRRWGAALATLLLIAFMIYMGVEYNALHGDDCSCFPWVKRVVGPGFFIADGLMLALAVIAGIWARPTASLRSAWVVAGAVVVFALVSYGVAEVRDAGVRGPDTVTVANQPYSIEHGKVFLYFFNPECMHCFAAAKRMSKLDWGATRVMAVPVDFPQYAQGFLSDSGLRAIVTSDFQKLKPIFKYTTYPYGIALEDGREKASLTKFDGDEPVASLKQLGFAK